MITQLGRIRFNVPDRGWIVGTLDPRLPVNEI